MFHFLIFASFCYTATSTEALTCKITANPNIKTTDTGVYFDSNINLTCVTVGGHVDSFSWTKDGVQINVTSSNPPSKLTLTTLTKQDSGTYQCTVKKGKVTVSDTYHLTVNVFGECDYIFFCNDQFIFTLIPDKRRMTISFVYSAALAVFFLQLLFFSCSSSVALAPVLFLFQ